MNESSQNIRHRACTFEESTMKNENGLPEAGHGQWENLARTHSEFDVVDYSLGAIFKRHVTLSSGGVWPAVCMILLLVVFTIYTYLV
jgi:hypothetical protein